MAESHSEDSPLLGSTDASSPGECSPGSQGGVSPSWSNSFLHTDAEASPNTWTNGGHRRSSERLHVPPRAVNTPKIVHSQTSMDSGCDCDPSEGESPPLAAHREEIDPTGISPLSPSQPGASQPPSPGPSGFIAPLAQKESLDCQCGSLEQRCICDIQTCGVELGQGSPRSHLDRVDLPKVTFCIEGYDEDEPSNQRFVFQNGVESSSQSGSEPGDDFRVMVKGAVTTFPRVTSYPRPGMLSASSSTASMPMCRICHFPQGEDPDTLISPCRCSGTMQFIHESCLMKWLDVSKSKKTASCELCNYQYNRHKKFRLRHWELPSCSRLDKILHSIFLLCLIVMATCATITIYFFKQNLNKIGSLTWLREDRFIKKREDTDLTKSEIVTLTCGVLFFVAFFLAMYVEVKARDTLYRLFSRFIHLNQTWHIDEYDRQRDNQHAPV